MLFGKFSRRGFMKGLGAASVALGAGKLTPVAAEAEEDAPSAAASRGRDRSIRGAEFPEEHFRIRRTPIKWPNNARIAVCWIVNYECYSDTSNSFDIPYKDYSSKAGFRRLIDLFDANGVKAGWYTNALIATRYPDTLRELARRGHELVGHNWANNISMTRVTEDEEHEIIKRTFGDIEKASGLRPIGWF